MKEKLRNKKVVYTIIGIVSVLLVALAVTYAYWLVTKTQTGENEISSACLDISISGEKNDITLTNQFPMSDEDGMKLVPYEFTVTNNCNTSIDYQIALEATGTESSAMVTSSLKVALNDSVSLLSSNAEVDAIVSGAYESRKLGMGTLASAGTEGSSVTYKLRIWIDEDAPISEMNKTFKSKISVTIGQGIANSSNNATLASAILSNYGGAAAIRELDASTGVFENITTADEAGLYKTQDDLGDSYYFRGASSNNYVQFGYTNVYYENQITGTEYPTFEECGGYDYCFKFGGPMYWRIVRINGDRTIRLIYDGNEIVKNGTGHKANIGTSKFVDTQDHENAKYMGYTYDTSDTDTTQVDSAIKGVVDEWYDEYLKTNYANYITDSIFCNDRSIGNVIYFDLNGNIVGGPTSPGFSQVFYGALKRLTTDKAPSLKCPNQSDRYTANDTTNGNGLLSNPVGLVTADELVFAGNVPYQTNTSYYLYTGEKYWTMSPASKISGSISMVVYTGGNQSVNELLGVRPVINLKADVAFTGTGTIDDPYVIK